MIIKYCKKCNKEFKIWPSHIKNNVGKFCNQKCFFSYKKEHMFGENNPNWKGGSQLVKCQICDNNLVRRRAEISKGYFAKFCSIRCARLNQIFPKKDSSIEIKLQKLLKENSVPFETHYPLLGQPDIFISPNICIFADGCYWHKCPECGFGKGREKDVKITQELQSKGYTVIRIWEHDINQNLDKILNNITKV